MSNRDPHRRRERQQREQERRRPPRPLEQTYHYPFNDTYSLQDYLNDVRETDASE